MATRVIQHPNLTAAQAAARVSLLKSGDTKQVADIFAGHVWEATGYGFTLVDSEYHVNGSIGLAGHVRSRLPRRGSDRVVVREVLRAGFVPIAYSRKSRNASSTSTPQFS